MALWLTEIKHNSILHDSYSVFRRKRETGLALSQFILVCFRQSFRRLVFLGWSQVTRDYFHCACCFWVKVCWSVIGWPVCSRFRFRNPWLIFSTSYHLHLPTKEYHIIPWAYYQGVIRYTPWLDRQLSISDSRSSHYEVTIGSPGTQGP